MFLNSVLDVVSASSRNAAIPLASTTARAPGGEQTITGCCGRRTPMPPASWTADGSSSTMEYGTLTASASATSVYMPDGPTVSFGAAA